MRVLSEQEGEEEGSKLVHLQASSRHGSLCMPSQWYTTAVPPGTESLHVTLDRRRAGSRSHLLKVPLPCRVACGQWLLELVHRCLASLT